MCHPDHSILMMVANKCLKWIANYDFKYFKYKYVKKKFEDKFTFNALTLPKYGTMFQEDLINQSIIFQNFLFNPRALL